MFRKFTALSLLWLMSVVVATSQPGLQYCLCLKTLSVGGCECPEKIDQEKRPVTADETACASHCSSCPTSEGQSKEAESRESLVNDCRDCSLSLFICLDDFIGAEALQGGPGGEGQFAPSYLDSPDPDVVSPGQNSIAGIRGSPPPSRFVRSLPLRVRYSVFLL